MKNHYTNIQFITINFSVWLVIFIITVSESVFYYQINNLETPYLRIFVFDSFLIIWSLITPSIYMILENWYNKLTNWKFIIIKFLALGIFACLFIFSTETAIRWVYNHLLNRENILWPLIIDVFTSRLHINAILFFTVIGLSIAYLENKKTRDLEKKQSILNQQLIEAELDVLKRQMRPHLLFNSLHAISALVLKNENALAISMITKFGDLLRESLRLDRRPWISLKEEIAMATRYLEIHSMRFGSTFSFDFKVNEKVLECKVPSLILQPIIENSLVHGIVPNDNKGTIKVIVEKDLDNIHFHIYDLVESCKTIENMKEGIGLSNTKKRLMALYEENHKFSYGPLNKGNGFETRLTFPILTIENES